MRGRLKRLEREAKKNAILIHQRDGTVRAFDASEVGMEMFMVQYDLFMGKARACEVLDAVRNATPESRAAFEAKFGEITMQARILAADYQGGWVEEYNLLEDGTVERIYYEGGSPEVKRIKAEAQQRGTPADAPGAA